MQLIQKFQVFLKVFRALKTLFFSTIFLFLYFPLFLIVSFLSLKSEKNVSLRFVFLF